MKRKTKKKKQEKGLIQDKNRKQDEAVDEEKPLDFGGLPERSLKKNIGC
jgi:hypothetical protein